MQYRSSTMKKIAVATLALFSTLAFAQDRVAKFDRDEDGKVDIVELRKSCDVSHNLFEKADKNGDGALSNFEMRTAKAYLFTKCDEKVA
jgi:Ca2+-binding EF-hand superfamily protein